MVERTIDALLLAQPAPLVVRVTPRSAHERLSDELPGAVEDALTRAQAPGGLYDDRGPEALRSLGGWLFRARSVGRRGLVLVVDDLDLWTDVRGTQQREAPWLFVLLEETRRRSVSLLGSARAASAAGTPALSQDLLSRMDAVHSLGGTITVTRDPTTIVPALAGRSFSHAGLHRAFERWLDLPQAPEAAREDALIVFSSPLAPPVFEHPPIEATLGPEVEWEPLPTPSTVANETPSARVGRWGRGLQSAIAVRESSRSLARCPMEDFVDVERCFLDCAARLPLALETLDRTGDTLGLSTPALARHGAHALDRFESRFASFLRDERHRTYAPGEGPTRAADLPPRLLRLAEHAGARSTAVIVMTGMRYDLFTRWKERVLPLVGALTLVREGIHWAPGGEARTLASADIAADLEAAIQPSRAHRDGIEVHRIDAYACALARPEESLTDAAESVEVLLPSTLRALCGTLPGPSAVLLLADVGVGERREGPSIARTLAGDSAFEVLVPYALLTFG